MIEPRDSTALPRVVTRAAEATAWIRAAQAAPRRVGLVPTMGALHAGHASLVRAARAECDVVVATIFVNPTQFGPNEDFQKYPRTLPDDLEMLRDAGADLVFVPEEGEIYRPGSSTTVDPPCVARPLEGEFRPGHFRGVATVVLKLFLILPADAAYFGAKDYQQTLVVRHMAADLNVPVCVCVCPTVREADGLAMSSRNRYLSPAERRRSLALSRGLRAAESLYRAGERATRVLEQRIRDELHSADITRIDYVAVADPDSLERPERVGERAVALIAAHVGTTRLIDNLMLE